MMVQVPGTHRWKIPYAKTYSFSNPQQLYVP